MSDSDAVTLDPSALVRRGHLPIAESAMGRNVYRIIALSFDDSRSATSTRTRITITQAAVSS